MKKLITLIIISMAAFLSNCAWGQITRSSVGGQQMVHVGIVGLNLFNTAPSKGNLFHTANASLEQCEKWLAQEGVSSLDTVNNANMGVMMVQYNQLNDSILYQGPFSTYSSTRYEGCEGIGGK